MGSGMSAPEGDLCGDTVSDGELDEIWETVEQLGKNELYIEVDEHELVKRALKEVIAELENDPS